MIQLFVKTGCPYCAAVLAKVDDLSLTIEEKNVSDPKNVEELLALGGKKQEPFLYDKEHNIKLYESDAIIEYLNKTYGDGTSGEKVSLPDGVCPA